MPTTPPLHFGPYVAPACRKGSWIVDEIHGLVQVNGWTDGPLGWPTRKRPNGGPRAIAVTADLVRAIATESEVAVAYWFGISTKRVRELRRVLDVGSATLPAHVGNTQPSPSYRRPRPARAAVRGSPAIPTSKRGSPPRSTAGLPVPRHARR